MPILYTNLVQYKYSAVSVSNTHILIAFKIKLSKKRDFAQLRSRLRLFGVRLSVAEQPLSRV